jgi:hypothetical protein
MDGIENRLAAMGFRPKRRVLDGWWVERAGRPRPRPGAPRSDPEYSPVLSVWLERLCDQRRPAAYRIRRLAEGD